MRIQRGKARKQARRKAIYSSRFSSDNSANRPAAGLARAVDLYRLRHELRTPLTGMLGLAELLSAQDLPGHAAFWLATLQACGQQMASLIDRSLRPDVQSEGIAHGAETGTEGGGFLERLICSHRPAAEAGDTRLHLLIQPPARTCWRVDPVLLRQALDNLLANAIRFSPEGYVLLEASVLPSGILDADTLQLVVENSGSGHSHHVESKNASALQIADGSFNGRAAAGFDYADRSYRMFSRGQGLQVVEQVCAALHGQLQRSHTAMGGARFVLQLPAVILRRENQIKSFGPDLLRKLHCRLLLEQPMLRVVAALLTGLDLSFEHIDNLQEAAFQALPERQLLICNPLRLPAVSLDMKEIFNPRSICLVARLIHYDKSEWYVQPLSEPLLQSDLQAALLRCLVLQGMSDHRAQLPFE